MTTQTASPTAGSRSARRRPWWRGGSSVRRWRADLIGWAILGLGAGLVFGGIATIGLGGAAGPAIGTLVLWAGMLVPIAVAFSRGIPRGLLRVRPADLVYGVVLGGMLRIMQGWTDRALGGDGALPAYPSLGGHLPPGWWIDDVLGGVIAAPAIEELFFRGVLLVAVFTVVRRFAGRDAGAVPIAGFVAVLASTGLFVLSHQLAAPVSADAAVGLAALGLVAGVLVVSTGRIGGALVLHLVYNATGVVLTVAGTLLG